MAAAKGEIVSKEVVDDLVSGWIQSMSKGRSFADPQFSLPELTPRNQAYYIFSLFSLLLLILSELG